MSIGIFTIDFERAIWWIDTHHLFPSSSPVTFRGVVTCSHIQISPQLLYKSFLMSDIRMSTRRGNFHLAIQIQFGLNDTKWSSRFCTDNCLLQNIIMKLPRVIGEFTSIDSDDTGRNIDFLRSVSSLHCYFFFSSKIQHSIAYKGFLILHRHRTMSTFIEYTRGAIRSDKSFHRKIFIGNGIIQW